MADLQNRRILINLHSDSKAATADMLNLGEIAIKHDNTMGATIYTKTTDGQVAEFITKAYVDDKDTKINNALSAHTTAYGIKIAEIEGAISDNADAISAETDARVSADTAFNNRLTAIETALGDADTENSIIDRLGDVEAKAQENANAISAETKAREDADSEINTILEGHDTRITSAQTTANEAKTAAATADAKAVSAQTTANEAKTAAATADAKAVSAQTTANEAKAAAGTAQTAAENAQKDATQALANAASAQTDATYAKDKIDAFLLAADVTQDAIDTLKEIQDYIGSHGEAAANMVSAITSAQTTANSALTAANEAMAAAEAADAKAVSAQTTADEAKAAAAEVASALTETAKAIREEFAEADAALKGTEDDAAGFTSIMGALKSAAAAQKDATQALTNAETANSKAVSAQTTANEAKAAAATADAKAVSAQTTANEANTAAKEAKSAIEKLDSEVVKSGLITGAGDDIEGTVVKNVLTFDFSALVIDCGTF